MEAKRRGLQGGVQAQTSLGIKSLDEDGGRGDWKRWTIFGVHHSLDAVSLCLCMGFYQEDKVFIHLFSVKILSPLGVLSPLCYLVPPGAHTLGRGQ